MEVLYDSDSVSVYQNSYVSTRRTPNLIVSFSSWNSSGKGYLFGREFFERRKIPALFIVQKINHWWHDPHIFDAIERINLLSEACGYEIICYGSSMGGYGCLHFSQRLLAKAAIAIAPQTFVNPQSIPDEKRWLNEREQIKFIFDETENLRESEVVSYIIYDNFHELDAAHVGKLQENKVLKNAVTLNAPYTSHDLARALSKIPEFKDFIFNAAHGVLDASALAAACHCAYLIDEKTFLNWIRRTDKTGISDHHLSKLLEITEEKKLISLDFESLYFAAEALVRFGYSRNAIVCSALSIANYTGSSLPDYLLLKHKLVCQKASDQIINKV